jgi:hypothetical protein
VEVTVVAFATAAGPRFCELTPTTITLSRPGHVPPSAGQSTLTFHTASGTMAGVVAPEATSLSLERPTDLMARQHVVILDGIFVVPNAFTVTPAGLVFRVSHNRTGDIVAADALPSRAVGVVDQPAPRADRESPAGRRLAAAAQRSRGQAVLRAIHDPSDRPKIASGNATALFRLAWPDAPGR